MRPIRAVIYGLGTMGRMATRYLKEKDIEVAAAYVRSVEGKDFSAPELEGVEICRSGTPFEKFGADIVLMTHGSRLDDLYEPAMLAAKAGLDVLTIAEDAFEPFYLDKDLPKARELDAAFRAHGKTLVSVGVQDTFWFAQPLAFLASVQKLDRLIGKNICDLGQFGSAAQHADGIGLTEAEFHAAGHGGAPAHRGIFEVALRPLLRALSLSIEAVTVTKEPVLAERDFHVPRLDRTIRAGTSCGSMERVIFELKGGIVAEGQFIMRFMPEDEGAYNEWIVEGTPGMNMRTDNFHGDAITCASLVNRVRDTLDAPAGFLSVDQLKAPRYQRQMYHPA